MSVMVNGRIRPLSEPEPLAALLRLLAPAAPFAVAHNELFVRREDYAACMIYPGDRLDIVEPTVGG